MQDPNLPHKMDSEKSIWLDREEHLHRGQLGAKRVVLYTYDSDTDTLEPYTGSGGGGTAAYTDGTDDAQGLVDGDGHVQVDVLTMPAVTVDPPVGGATEAKQDTVIGHLDGVETKLDTIASNQLPDGHAVEVNNLPTEYPLPSAQVTALTPPAAITGYATSSKQDDLLTELRLNNGAYAQQVDIDSGDATITYRGWAVAGTATSAALWRITRITDDGSGAIAIDFADGNINFDNQWSNRESLSYA